MSTLKSLRRLAAIALTTAALGAQAANFTTSGNLVYNTDVVQIDFTLASAGDVTLWTDSWQAGLNFDPTLSVFDGSLQLLATGDDTSDPAALLPGQGGYDGQITLTLAAGHYLLSLSASGNDPLGVNFGDGFSLQGTTPIAIADWNQPSYDINKNDQKGSVWQIHLDGVTTFAAVAAVPEPSEWALMLASLGCVVAATRRRRTSVAHSLPRLGRAHPG